MRAYEFIILKEAALTSIELFNPKYDRPVVLMKKITNGDPLTLVSGETVTIDNSPENLINYQTALDNKQLPKLIDKATQKVVPMGNILKTTEFGGHGVSAGTDPTTVLNKTTLALKPVNIEIADKPFNRKTLVAEIINNSILQQTEHGRVVIEMARQLAKGQVPQYNTEFQKPVVAAIQDDAGEYLGVLALLYQTALNFPSMKQFMEHLKISDLGGLAITFPSKINEPLGDSFAVKGTIRNLKTGNRILISSKGKTGAAPSLAGLAIPADLESNPEYENEVAFVKLIQTTTPADYQPLKAANFIHNIDAEKLPQWIRDHLPFTDDQMREIMKWKDNKKYQISNAAEYADQVPEWLSAILGKIPPTKKVAPHASPGGWLLYKVTKAVMEAVNKNNALPNFEPIAREILQRNFIQVNATANKGQMTFSVMWPNKEMGTGTITLQTKNTAATTGSSLGFRVK
jgi:hypothetical protein